MTPDEKKQVDNIEALKRAVQELASAYEATGDVTMHEFQQISQAREDLTNLVKTMYERSIYKDD